jgi:branched-chain amino acid transport system ATP-binding protein
LAPLIDTEIRRVIADIRAGGIATLIVDRDHLRVSARFDSALVLQKGVLVLGGGRGSFKWRTGGISWLLTEHGAVRSARSRVTAQTALGVPSKFVCS